MGRWSIAYRIHDAQFWGVPQRRKRLALVADFAGLTAAEILFERKSLHWNSEESGETGKTAAGRIERGFEDSGQTVVFEGNGSRSSHRGNGWRESDVMYTLNTVECHAVYENHSQDSRYKALGETCETVSAKYGTGGNNTPLVLTTATCIGNGQSDLFSHITEEVSQTLNCMHDQQIVVTAKERNKRDSIRRLTPTECERLQGFPDGWTDIGEWTDSKGKLHKESSDSARYKALGNSIALPYWQYLARRICAQYERDITIGSLFDGIGGFPYVFEKCGAKAVWASEIDEFCIAVTKKHFPEDE